VDIDRLLVETDSPFLAPQKLRGRDNEPANVVFTIEEVARVRDEDVRTVAEATSRNATDAFPGIS
jgi:TatD DNase family protein